MQQICEDITLFPLLTPQRLDCRIPVEIEIPTPLPSYLERIRIRLISGIQTPIQNCSAWNDFQINATLSEQNERDKTIKELNTTEVRRTAGAVGNIIETSKKVDKANKTSEEAISAEKQRKFNSSVVSKLEEDKSKVNFSSTLVPNKTITKYEKQTKTRPAKEQEDSFNCNNKDDKNQTPPNVLLTLLPPLHPLPPPKKSLRKPYPILKIIDFKPKAADFLGGTEVCLFLSSLPSPSMLSAILLPPPFSCLHPTYRSSLICCILPPFYSLPTQNPFNPCIFFKNGEKICSKEQFTLVHDYYPSTTSSASSLLPPSSSYSSELTSNSFYIGRKRKFEGIKNALEKGMAVKKNTGC